MTLLSILIFGLGALVYGTVLPARFRPWALLVGSVAAIFWLQPSSAVRPVDFVLPTGTLIVAIGGWWLTRKEDTFTRDDAISLGVTAGIVIVLALVGWSLRLVPSPTPGIFEVAPALLGLGVVGLAFVSTLRSAQDGGTANTAQNLNRAIHVYIALIIVLFVILKYEPFTVGIAGWLRAATERPVTLAGVIDVGWLGFSYVAFRLIHTLRDRQTGKLPALSLREYLTYIIFFPAFTAGPIDRAERFVKDLRALDTTTGVILTAPHAVEGVGRILMGILKKFVVADSLAIFALNAANATDALNNGSALGLWFLLYGYAFRLYLDFSGYSDIAIGIARLYGINLPENFNMPYTKDSITAFWQSWHMTLSTWARFYVFTPLSRVMMGWNPKPTQNQIVFVAQMSTMIVIGLWHGITLNFILWGIWHGLGLFLHKLYTDRTRTQYLALNDTPQRKRIVYWGGVALTFHFVALGWVFFALPDTALSMRVIAGLFGVRI